MNGFKAFKYYAAIKLHFSQQSFDVFANRGKLKGSYEKFLMRHDHKLFDQLARQFDEKEYIRYLAANFMYGNDNVVYSAPDAMANYKEFLRRRQSITRIFQNDLEVIKNSGAKYDFSGLKIPDVLQLLLANKITIETVVILDDLDNIVTKMKQNQQLNLLLGDELRRIEKSRKFIKFDRNKIMEPYVEFRKEVQ